MKIDSKTPLRKAVDWLRYTGRINKDEDLATEFGLKKNTISTYLNGKPGKRFVEEFEDRYKIKLKDFEHSSKKGSKLTAKELKDPEIVYKSLVNQVDQLTEIMEQNKALINVLAVEIMEIKAALKISTISLEQKFAKDAQIALNQVRNK